MFPRKVAPLVSLYLLNDILYALLHSSFRRTPRNKVLEQSNLHTEFYNYRQPKRVKKSESNAPSQTTTTELNNRVQTEYNPSKITDSKIPSPKQPS